MGLENLPNIAEAVIEKKKTKISVWPVKSNYASEAGHPCERYLYYRRTAWEYQTPHDVALQFIFDGGRDIEDQAITELKDAGFRVVEQQARFHWKEYDLGGAVDARIQVNRALPPVEIKGYAHRDWTLLNSVDDFLTSSRIWHVMVPAQLFLYQLMTNTALGLIYIKSKSTYMPKSIWVDLNDHLDYAEGILKKLERVNHSIANGIEPDYLFERPDVCRDCSYFAHCQPNVAMAEGAEIMDDEELLSALNQWWSLRDSKKQYEEVDKYVKQRLKGTEKGAIGPYIITGKQISGDRKPSPSGPYEYWRTSITRFNESIDGSGTN